MVSVDVGNILGHHELPLPVEGSVNECTENLNLIMSVTMVTM